jgi:ATP-dependent protease ClpP protease subunit
MEKFLLDKSRTIPLVGEIEDCACEALAFQLTYLAQINKPIVVMINSYGGSVAHGLGILGLIHSCPVPVWIVGNGLCWSMAAVIVALGPEGYRAATPGTSFLLHPAKGLPGDDSDLLKNLRGAADFFDKLDRDLNKEFCKRTKYTLRKFQKQMDNGEDLWLTADQARAKGLFDEYWDHELWADVNTEIRRKAGKSS